MSTTSDVMRELAKDENYIVRDLTGTPRLVMKDGNGKEICTVLEDEFDALRAQSFLKLVLGRWRLNDAGKSAVHRS